MLSPLSLDDLHDDEVIADDIADEIEAIASDVSRKTDVVDQIRVLNRTVKPRSPLTEIEVILCAADKNHFWIQAYEDAVVIKLNRYGVRLVERKPRSVILEMNETKAITYDLV
jgi:hypothetical protein